MTCCPSTEDDRRELERLVSEGRWQDALLFYRGARSPGFRDRAEGQLLAARAAGQLGQFDSASVLAAAAHEGCRAVGDTRGVMQALHMMGAAAFEFGRLEEAEVRFEEVLHLAHRTDDGLMAARASTNLASVVHLRGRRDLAVSLYRSALEAYQRLDHPRGAAETSHNLGLLYRQQGDLVAAEKAAATAIGSAELSGDLALLALTMVGRAEIEFERGDLAIAREHLARAAALAAEAGDDLVAAEAGRLGSLLHLRCGEYEEAYHEAERSRAVADRHGCRLLQAESTAVSARALKGLGRLPAAQRLRREALRGFRALPAPELIRRFESEWKADLPAA